ncbi:Pyridoxal 5'-phosphate synthase subunit PdxT [Geodia barretti]|uniref:glutaminase n=1 Tax=Geodia barretti TaxID=519541 RepID=A0AA35SSZ7_GEOBA|nr:Pyridoxal 5'-phosphate synthase subunit PdxT [Geodia barretti]
MQGDFAAHKKILGELGVESKLVKKPADLAGVEGLIIPGGESTTLLKLMAPVAMRPALEQFHAQGRPIFGTCAGLILLAQETLPRQESLGFIDIVVRRNAYGRQIDSFVALGTPLTDDLSAEPLEMVFIRAPKIAQINSGVTPLAECRGKVVLARQGSVLVSSFHPELTQDRRVHQYFLQMLAAG